FVKIYGPKMVENCVQALAALLIREQMVDIGVKFRVVLQVHDEIVVAVPKDQAEGARAWIEQCMVTPPTWASGLPVACESGVAVNYGDT
ncbi:MAG TPA: DNA polymerase, partial [Coriobacteriia bacterium]|nr:DNA polymerase [Coriobacteriia bacterium]